MMSIGAGIYLGASIIDHSCNPNAVAVFEGTTLYIRALKNFHQPVDWSKVKNNYYICKSFVLFKFYCYFRLKKLGSKWKNKLSSC